MRSRNWSILLLKLEPQGKQVWYLWKKSQFITPVEEMSTYYPSPCLSVYSRKQPVVQPTCNFYTRRGFFVPLSLCFCRMAFNKNRNGLYQATSSEEISPVFFLFSPFLPLSSSKALCFSPCLNICVLCCNSRLSACALQLRFCFISEQQTSYCFSLTVLNILMDVLTCIWPTCTLPTLHYIINPLFICMCTLSNDGSQLLCLIRLKNNKGQCFCSDCGCPS